MIMMKMPILVHVYVLFSNRTVMLNAIAEQDCKRKTPVHCHQYLLQMSDWRWPLLSSFLKSVCRNIRLRLLALLVADVTVNQSVMRWRQGSFPKQKSPWERRVRVPKVQGSRCRVWGVMSGTLMSAKLQSTVYCLSPNNSWWYNLG